MDDYLRIEPSVIAQGLRQSSIGWRNAKSEYEGVISKKMRELSRHEIREDEGVNKFKIAYEYLADKLGGDVRYLSNDTFVIDYDLRCDLLGLISYGVTCLSLSFTIKWERRNIIASYVSGSTRSVQLNTDLISTVKLTKPTNLNKFAESTGFSNTSVKSAQYRDLMTILDVLRTHSGGQNKVSRLVKGCLIYLDLLERGPIDFAGYAIPTVVYSAEGVAHEYDATNTSYVFSGHSKSAVHNYILYAMCEGYPHHRIGGMRHITVPEDSPVIKLVSYEEVTVPANVHMTAELVWGTLTSYAEMFSLGDDLGEAIMIACSMRENRYLDKIGLPRVVSACDLIYPALAAHHRGNFYSDLIDLKSAKCVGRAHQMLCSALVKDVDTSGTNTSSSQMNIERTVRANLARDIHLMIDYTNKLSGINILSSTPSMQWVHMIGDNDIRRIRRYTAFESLWLINNPKEVIQDGMVRCLKKGMKDPIGIEEVGIHLDAYQTLMREIRNGGFTGELHIPDGAFNARFACIRGAKRRVKEIDFEDDDDLECDIDVYHPCLPGNKHTGEDDEGWEDDSGEEEEKEIEDLDFDDDEEPENSPPRGGGTGGGGGSNIPPPLSPVGGGGVSGQQVIHPREKRSDVPPPTGGEGMSEGRSTRRGPVPITFGSVTTGVSWADEAEAEEAQARRVKEMVKDIEGKRTDTSGTSSQKERTIPPPIAQPRPKPAIVRSGGLKGPSEYRKKKFVEFKRPQTVQTKPTTAVDAVRRGLEGGPRKEISLTPRIRGTRKRNTEDLSIPRTEITGIGQVSVVQEEDEVSPLNRINICLGCRGEWIVSMNDKDIDMPLRIIKSIIMSSGTGWYNDISIRDLLTIYANRSKIIESGWWANIMSSYRAHEFPEEIRPEMTQIIEALRKKEREKEVGVKEDPNLLELSKEAKTELGRRAFLAKECFQPTVSFKLGELGPLMAYCKKYFWFRERVAKLSGKKYTANNITSRLVDRFIELTERGVDEENFSLLVRALGDVGNMIFNLRWEEVIGDLKRIVNKKNKEIKWRYSREELDKAKESNSYEIALGKERFDSLKVNDYIAKVSDLGNKIAIVISQVVVTQKMIGEAELYSAIMRLVDLTDAEDDAFCATLKKYIVNQV